MTPLLYLRLFAPEFESATDATVEQWLAIAGSVIVVDCLDAERAAMAQALYAAHLMAVAARTSISGSGPVGQVVLEREGDIQRSYGTVRGGDSQIGQTQYGLQYLEIVRPCSGSAIMTRVAP